MLRLAPVKFLMAYFVALFSILTVLAALGRSDADTAGWENVRVLPDRKVASLKTWVDQTSSNARECIRMCWLYSACSALTFTLDERRCQLYQTDGDRHVYRTVPDRGSLAVDMRTARTDSTQVRVFFWAADPGSRSGFRVVPNVLQYYKSLLLSHTWNST